eukprot:TRINITY_DN16412_c0_g1_i1.p1 TRINITY_DN16412_c0_g1~~TRINITY_DN16412_c0_g1_i1.p1  ORF type:complete len:113 (+),score=12.57 TRINITY_DN16412_c0_g1_i1:49-387(+)
MEKAWSSAVSESESEGEGEEEYSLDDYQGPVKSYGTAPPAHSDFSPLIQHHQHSSTTDCDCCELICDCCSCGLDCYTGYNRYHNQGHSGGRCCDCCDSGCDIDCGKCDCIVM